ncbi:protein of unknown function (DUF4347)/Outer membrane protein beta-barrel domain [Shewanella psychrophila]|uniref:Cadherin domain-containing protein n=1 Tax=Shewanella psychrophila TaxID=225848 RepID=A0A1S6HWY1_9GAMM|nr:Ig-like domain-containing protein [Shewanella psychrophila]AQS40086.1 protein of unknown function (DUF4347)/Outer membrane protein beta-barrel domain [Shewanella psychrophila]
MKLDLKYPWFLLLTRWVSRFFSPLFSGKHNLFKFISKLVSKGHDDATYLSSFLLLITCLLTVQQAKATENETGYLLVDIPETELIVIDPAVHDPHMLYQALNAKFTQHLGLKNKTEIVFLRPELEPLQQIRNAIKITPNLSQVSIVSHASNGALFLSGKWIDKDYINQHEPMMNEIGASLKQGADLKLYGCNLASGVSGKSFINRVAELTQLDVAASTDTTGGVKQGHNWELEYQVGNIDSRSLFSEALPTSYSSTLNHFRYGTMAVEPIAGESGKVRLKVQIGYTLDHYIMTKLVNSSVGTVNCEMNYLAGFSWGDGQGQSNICVQLLSKDSATNDSLVEIVSQGANGYEPGIVHQYQADGDYTLSWNSYARSPARSQDNSYWRGELTTSVVNGEVTNASPVTAVSALVYVRDDHLFTMQVSGVDQDGDEIRYRWGEKREFYSGSSNAQVSIPTGMQLSSEGLITWDLAADLANGDLVTYTDHANPSTVTSNRWQAAIVLEDLDINGAVKSKAPLDFVFIISDPDNASPGFNPGPEITATQYIQLHQTTTFTISATDVDENGDPDVPILSVLNPPSTDPAIWSTSIISQDPVTGTSVIEVIFTPSDEMLGKAYAVIFSAKDSNGITSEASVNLVIVNEAPIAQDDTAFTQQGQTVIIDVLANDSDPDGDPLTITQFNAPNGTVVLNGDNTISYTPNANFSGLDTVSYVISDGIGSVAGANILVTVNGNPVAVDDLFSINEDTSSVLDVLGNDSEPDGNALNMTLTTPSHGLLSLVNNTVTYTPDAQFYGTDLFSYTINDGIGGSDTANVTVTVLSVNDLPVASNDSAELDEDQSISISVLTNDSDPENDPLVVTSHQSLHGSTTVNGDQSLTYAPALNYFGQDQITYSISDGNGGESTATVAITVRPVNDAPIAVNDSATLDEDMSVTVPVLANDSDIDGDILTVTVQPAVNGVASVTALGLVQYTPNANFNGADNLTYTIEDGNGGSASAVLSISVSGVNDQPVAMNDAASLDEDTSVTVLVLANDSDLDNDLLVVTAQSPANGDVTVGLDGSISYTPMQDFNGVDSLTYSIDDGHGGTAQAQLTITVNAVNDQPVAVDDYANVAEDGSVTFSVLSNDSDVDNDGLTVALNTASHGSTVNHYDGSVSYTPDANFNGSDSVQYSVSDGQGGEAQAVIYLNVTAVNDAPVAEADFISMEEDTLLQFDLLLNDTDVEFALNPASTVLIDLPLHMETSVENGVVTLTPNADFYGSDSLTYRVSDGDGAVSNIVSVTIVVAAVNDAPRPEPDFFSVDEDVSSDIDILANDIDIDDADESSLDIHSVAFVQAPLHGQLAYVGGVLSYQSDTNYVGPDSFSYTVADTLGAVSLAALVTINVQGINDAPVAVSDSLTADEDQSISFNVTANDTDIDSQIVPESVNLFSAPTHGVVSISGTGEVTYTPNADYFGYDSFSYTVKDSDDAVSLPGNVSVSIASINDAPRLQDDIAQLMEDGVNDINVLGNDTDIDGELIIDSLMVTVMPEHGVVSVLPGGLLRYAPDENYYGSDNFSYLIKDNDGVGSAANVQIGIDSINDHPLAQDDGAVLDEDSQITLDILANDTDLDGVLDVSSVVITSSPTSGTLEVNADGSVRYTPDANFNGSDSFSYRVSDDEAGVSESALVNIQVTSVNDGPDAQDDSMSLDEDSSLTYAVLDNDTDIENHPLTVSIAQPSHGQASVEANGSITYVPDADFNGSDTMIYTIDDGHGGQDSALLSVTVNGVNDAPVAVNDSATLDEDMSVTVPVLANDSDIDGDTLTVTVQPAVNGVASVTALGLVKYTPNANFNGFDNLTYTIEDGNGGSASAVLSISVSGVNDQPVAMNDAASLDEDTSVTVLVLANDSDLDNDLLVVTAQSPANGDVTVGLDGSISYTPMQDFNGVDSLTYSIDDGHGGTVQAQLTITVNAVNDQPVAVDDYANVAEDGSVTFSVLSNDSDVDNDGLTVTLSSASYGSSVNHYDGTVTYTPDANFNGSDSVQYSVNDGQGGEAQAVVYLNVTAVNDAPVAETDLISMMEDTSLKFDLLLNDTDVEFALNPASAVLVDLPLQMSASVENGVVTLTPNADFNGSDSLTYRVSDGDGAVSNIVSVTIVVSAVNDAPRPEPDFASVEEDIILDIAVLVNDVDIDDSGESSLDIHSVVIVQTALHGQLTNIDGVLSYYPDSNYVGPDSFSYTVADIEGAVSQVTLVTLNVQGINDAPVAVTDSATLDEDGSIKLTVTANDTDFDSVIDSDSVVLFSAPTHGVVSIYETGEVTYTPNADYFGDDSFSYTIKDSEGAVSLPGNVNVSITSVNDAPRLQDDVAELVEDGVNDINVLGNDSDVDGDLVVASLVVTLMPEYGTVSVLPSGLLRYTPEDNYYGPDSFSYLIKDNDGASSEANVEISIDSINDKPLAQDDDAVLEEDSAVTINILANDSDLDGVLDVSSVVITSAPSSGTLEINADGSLGYTPDTNFNGSDSFRYQVSDDEGESSDAASVSLEIAPVNDTPEISGSSPETLVEGDDYLFTPISSDVDNDTLLFTITGSPTWASFDPLTGTLSGTPDYDDVGSYGPIVIYASDGNLEVVLDPFYIDVEVLDSDGDGIPDTIELELGLDPFDATDAGQDADGDGLSNFDEWQAGSNLYVDDVAPELVIPDDIWIDATGLFTSVSVGQAQAYDYVDGVRQPCCENLSHSLVSDEPLLKPGSYQVLWTAIDAAGNMSEQLQNIFVRPLISLPQDQIVSQGNRVSVSFHLNGLSPQYPLTVAYNIAGSAIEGLHHDLSSGVVVFEPGQIVATLEFSTFDIEQDEVVSIHLDDLFNLGSKKEHYVTITLDNLAPEIQLSSYQFDEKRTWLAQVDGTVEIKANYTDPNSLNSHTLDWSLTDSELKEVQLVEGQGVIQKVSQPGVSGAKLAAWLFDPSGLVEGIYTVRVTVTDDGEPNLSHFNELRVRVSEHLPVLTSLDSDGDGISDIDEGLGDTDGDGIPDYLDPISAGNVLPERIANTESYLVECESGIDCRLGQYAMSGVYLGAQVAGSDIQDNLQGIAPGGFVDVGGVFNIEAMELSEHNQVVNIVIPQRNPVPEHPGYRHFIHDKGWFTFEINGDNQLMSAPGAAGYCPPPGSDEYSEGLNQGDWCLQLVIQDGGANDADEMANGAVNITGCLIQEEPEPATPETDTSVEVEILTEGGGASSGGSMQTITLYLLIVVGFFRNKTLRTILLLNKQRLSHKYKHLQSLAYFPLFFLVSVSVSVSVFSRNAIAVDVDNESGNDELVGWFVSGLYGQSQTSEGASDINALLADAGLTAEVIELDTSTTGWKLGVGYAFTANWSATLEYVDLGEVSVRIKGATDNPQAFYATASQFYPSSAKGVGLNLGYRYQFAGDFSVLLHGGLLSWRSDYTSYDIDTKKVATSEQDGNSFYGGLGLEYALSKNIRLSVQWSHVELDDTNRDLLGAGMQYLF